MATETEQLRTAINATARQARYALHSGAGGGDTRFGATEITTLLARAKAEGINVRSLFEKFRVEVPDGGEPLASLLRSSGTLRRFMDDENRFIHIVGNVGCSVSRAMQVEEACGRIVKSVAFHSLDPVIDAVASFLRTGAFPMRTLHLLKGARVREPIKLDTSARLVPYSTALNMAAIDDGASTGVNYPADPGTGACGLILDAAVRPGAAVHPIEGASLDEVARSGVREEEKPRLLYSGIAEFGHDFVCVMLSLVSGKFFMPFCSYEIIPQVYSDALPMFASTGSRVVSNVEFPIFASQDELAFVDREELIELVTAYSQASEPVRRHLHVPLARLRHARDKAGDIDRAIDLQIAFEALLGRPTSDERQERAAWLYAETSDEVAFVKRTIREFSAHRNRIVHAKTFDENTELITQAESILVVCIKWIIRNRRIPRWTAEMTSAMGNPEIEDPSLIRSRNTTQPDGQSRR